MGNDIIQADYEELEGIAKKFAQQSEQNEQMFSMVRSHVDQLKNGGWQGRGANAFYEEIESAIYPSLCRLISGLEQGNKATSQIIHIIKFAEEEAAQLFHFDLGQEITSRIKELENIGLDPDNSDNDLPIINNKFDIYDSNDVIKLLSNSPNRVIIEKTAERYGLDPVLLAGVVAAEMDFDFDLKDKGQEWLANKGIYGGDGPGLTNVHSATLSQAIKYLNENSLVGFEHTSHYDLSNENRHSFKGSVEAAAIVTAMYAHAHGKIDSTEDMAVIWGAFRTGIKGFIPGDPNYGFESLEDYQDHVARDTGSLDEKFKIGTNAYISQPYFEYFKGVFK